MVNGFVRSTQQLARLGRSHRSLRVSVRRSPIVSCAWGFTKSFVNAIKHLGLISQQKRRLTVATPREFVAATKA